MVKGLFLVIVDVGVGVGASLFILFFIALASLIATTKIENKIASSCELSGHVVINEKAYKCELMK